MRPNFVKSTTIYHSYTHIIGSRKGLGAKVPLILRFQNLPDLPDYSLVFS